MTRKAGRQRIGDFILGTTGGALATYMLASAVVVLLTGQTLPLVPRPLSVDTVDVLGSITVRLLLSVCYAGIGCGVFVCFRFVQELLRGWWWRDALAEARRLPSIW
jgi:hypothetical protein